MVRTATLVALVGCSFAVARVPDRPIATPFPEQEHFDCQIIPAPILDTVVALAIATYAVTRDYDYMPNPNDDVLTAVFAEAVNRSIFDLENGVMLFTAASFFGSAAFGYDRELRCIAARRSFETDRTKRIAEHKAQTARREQAYQLTKAAEFAARSADCATVKRLALEVGKLDQEFFTVVFARDVAIAQCLAASD